MFSKLLSANGDWTGLALRLAIGGVLLPHGAQKLFGWFGGHGYSGTMQLLTQGVGLPWIVAFSVIVIEFFGALLLLTGFLSRFWALAVIGLMIGTVVTVHFPNGFFMNWSGAQAGEGFEYHLLMIGLSLALLVNGAGKFSVDRLITR